MFSRPSSRRKVKSEEVAINLVPMLDALVTIVAFLLFTTAFLSIGMIDTPAPTLSSAPEQVEKMKEKPLQLTATITENKIFITDWSGSRESHTISSVTDPKTGEPKYDFEKFHQTLVEIKHRHPKEVKLVFKPTNGIAYETLVALMDTARFLEKSDAPLYKKNAQGLDEPETALFSEVIFGNILSP
jgi:biopolymer transport protein ExbD